MKLPFVLAVTLAMACDALGGGVAAGADAVRRTVIPRAALAGISFGAASFLAVALGKLASLPFARFAQRFGRYAAAVLLAYLGADMMASALRRMRIRADAPPQAPSSAKGLFVSALLASANKLAAGAAFGMLSNDALLAAGLTGISSVLAAAVGVFFSRLIGARAGCAIPFAAGALTLGVGAALAADRLLLGGIL